VTSKEAKDIIARILPFYRSEISLYEWMNKPPMFQIAYCDKCKRDQLVPHECAPDA
jgi:hypothetical protein